MTLHISSTPGLVAHDFAEYFAEWAAGKPSVHLALSGGSTPRALFRHWAEHYRERIDWSSIHFYWGDERCVPPDDEESNFRMAHKLLLGPLGIPENQIYRIRGEAEPEAEAERYGRLLQQQLPTRHGLPAFDMIMLGMGEDGHTASIFPHQMELLTWPTPCAVAIHPETGQGRVTLTGPVLNNASEVAFLVTGAGKAEKVKEIFTGTDSSRRYPAAHINPKGGKLLWFTDEAAFV
ncbi:MAG: 6-phosphogluconolactonase [Phaeodactylibacter sp.]|nr:6-phosphogluconolactonase [Phaeodactylibacter sp.]MCB9272566.1 6-phosphogluconolactonase [Lewinellaceae bacterium]